ncbi:MAG TPA: hypothetical protein VIS48_11340 [Candidatus Kryptonia bacterium]
MSRLHYWLSYNRYTILLYGGGFVIPRGVFIPVSIIILTILAVTFAPYMLYVLYKNHNRGWIISFVVVVGIPTVLAFLSTGNVILDTGLHYLPLLMFYAYCFVLRLAVGEWISDASAVGELWTVHRDDQNLSGQ